MFWTCECRILSNQLIIAQDWSAKHIDGNTYTLQDSSGLYLAVAPDETVITSDQPFNWDITWVGTDGPWR